MSNSQGIKPRWPFAAILIASCIIPIFAFLYRGSALILENDWQFKFQVEHIDKLPLFIHVISSSSFYVLAAIQVWPPLRARFPVWHRKAGWVAMAAGIVGALSSVWITAIHREVQGDILFYGRMVFGPLWALFIVMGYIEIKGRNIAAHAAWMVRACAVAMPAGTLIFILGPVFLVFGKVSAEVEESIQSGAWIFHLAIAEFLFRRSSLHTQLKKVELT